MRYQIITLIPENEEPSFHVVDEYFDVEVAIVDSYEEAESFRVKRQTVDNLKGANLA